MTEAATEIERTVQRYRITRIAPLQAGKLMAAYMFLFASVGVLIVVCFLFFASLLPSLVVNEQPSTILFRPPLLIGLLPALYGLIGFVIGIVGSLIYNLVSKYLGGLELELTAQSTPQNKDTSP